MFFEMLTYLYPRIITSKGVVRITGVTGNIKSLITQPTST